MRSAFYMDGENITATFSGFLSNPRSLSIARTLLPFYAAEHCRLQAEISEDCLRAFAAGKGPSC